MNILIICRCLSIGGAERVAVSWANGLSELGHKVHIMADLSIPQTYTTNKDVSIIPLNPDLFKDAGMMCNVKTRIGFVKQVINVIDRHSIDIVIKVLYVNAIELLIARFLSKRKPPIVMTDHNAFERPDYAPMSRKLIFDKFWLNRCFDKVTVLTKRDKEITDAHGLKNVEVLYNPLFLSPNKNQLKHRKKNILAVGRIDSWKVKGFDTLIKAWSNLCYRYPEWNLKIIGKSSESSKKYLEELSGTCSQIEICSYTDDIATEYQKSEIFVLSSRYEGWGLVLVEAMSQGCACIACDFRGRQSEIIKNGISGLICRTDDIDDLANAIERLIVDTKTRSRLHHNAQEGLEDFSEHAVAMKLENIIKSVLG